MALFSESQAGYLHPLKFVFYPWMATWKALNLDTVASVWLTGLGTYGASAALVAVLAGFMAWSVTRERNRPAMVLSVG